MLSSQKMGQITEHMNTMGMAHRSQKVDLNLLRIFIKGVGISPQEVDSWQKQGGYSTLSQEAQQMFRDIFGDQNFELPIDRN